MAACRYFQLISTRRKHDNVIIFSVILGDVPPDKPRPSGTAGRQAGTDGVRQLWSVDLRDTVINGALALATFAYEIESKYLHWYTEAHKNALCVCVCAALIALWLLNRARVRNSSIKDTHTHTLAQSTYSHIHSRTPTLFRTPVWLDEISNVIQGASWRRRRSLQSPSPLEFSRRHLINPRTFVETFYFPTMALIAKASRLKVPRQAARIFAQATG